MDFGSFGEESAKVSTFQPPHRVVFSTEGERALAFEWLVEARDGGTCVVRLVNSGFGPGEDWDADFDGMSSGWRIFLENLRLHLTHFPRQRARAIIPTGMVAGPHDAAFVKLCAELGVPADLRAGSRFQTSGAGVPPLTGTVQSAQKLAATSTYFLLLDQPAPGHAFLTAEGAGDMVGISCYLYLYGPDAPALPDEWTPFFAERFPQPAAEPAAG
ncbi:MAG TPA: SRPBCC domain-containing protein [Micromonosporaceae bacterium]|nr:SRPBCC domain-containing protein [Micromonosporaceae bacterium]